MAQQVIVSQSPDCHRRERAVHRQCVVCGSTFERYLRNRDSGQCCSRNCGFELQRWQRAITSAVTAERNVYRRWSRRAKARVSAITRAEERLQREPLINPCLSCKKPAEKYKKLCEACRTSSRDASRKNARLTRKKTEAWRTSRRVAKSRRRAVERGALADRFDPIEILERDGWKCHLCSMPTPKRLRGTSDERAPELDHIVPLGQGGAHTRINTACACRRCNIAKADKPLGQMLLIG